MEKLSRESLYGLEHYARVRPQFRARVMVHKAERQIALGPHATLQFEDAMTMQYQVQEMLRAERISEPADIEGELAAYNPLIPDGSNWKATFMLEYEDRDERARALARLTGIEDRVWVQVDGCERVYAVADEDLERSNQDKTSAVHFLRFELAPAMSDAVRQGADVAVGVDHAAYHYKVNSVPGALREALAGDLN